MNIILWNFFNEFALYEFSGILPDVVFTILTHKILIEMSCMMWYKALNKTIFKCTLKNELQAF